ncbi:MAG: hypothetical protein AB7N76_24855 [Planctomycetota bacterium]
MERQEKLVLGLSLGGCVLALAALGLTGTKHQQHVSSGGAAARELPKVSLVATGEALDINPYVAQGKTLVEFTAEW